MTQTLESYIQTKANFIADYLFSNSLSPFNGGKSITTPLLGKVVGFYTGIIMPLNSAKFEYSNGPLEGINRKIKTLKRTCYGFANQKFFFLRIDCIFS